MSDYKVYKKIGNKRYPKHGLFYIDPKLELEKFNWVEFSEWLLRESLGVKPNPLPESCKIE